MDLSVNSAQLVGRAQAWLYASRRKLATGSVALLACLVAYHVVFGQNGMVAYQHKRTEYKHLQQQIQELQTENGRLDQQIKALKTDPAAIEKEAREQLRYTRPGEVVYVMPDPKPAAAPANATAQKQP